MNKWEFADEMEELLEENDGLIEFNFGDNFYWEIWTIEQPDLHLPTVKVGFEVGSGSGWIGHEEHQKEMGLYDLYDIWDAQKDLGEINILKQVREYFEGM